MLLHPTDTHTGVRYSLIPMTQAILGELLTPEQTQTHLDIIREHLLFAYGARLMDRPVRYKGGVETLFQRAESAAFFGREIGLMYVHSHLRYAETLSARGDAGGLWKALGAVNPIAVTDQIAHASLRQRNTYFSSSDAAFADRYEADAEWARLKRGEVAVDGGWRIYSSGPGLYINMIVQHALGKRRWLGKRTLKPQLPPSQRGLALSSPRDRKPK